MIKAKQYYETPEAELLVVRIEQGLLTISTQGNTIQDAEFDEWEDEL